MAGDLVERLLERAAELPGEIAERENEAQGHCGPYGTDTAADYADDYDVELMTEAADRIAALEAEVGRLREALATIARGSYDGMEVSHFSARVCRDKARTALERPTHD